MNSLVNKEPLDKSEHVVGKTKSNFKNKWFVLFLCHSYASEIMRTAGMIFTREFDCSVAQFEGLSFGGGGA